MFRLFLAGRKLIPYKCWIQIEICFLEKYANIPNRPLPTQLISLLMSGMVCSRVDYPKYSSFGPNRERLHTDDFLLFISFSSTMTRRTSAYDILPVSDALDIVLSHSSTLEPIECSLAEISPGFILAQDIFAKDPLPPFRASIMDGYAVIAEVRNLVHHPMLSIIDTQIITLVIAISLQII